MPARRANHLARPVRCGLHVGIPDHSVGSRRGYATSAAGATGAVDRVARGFENAHWLGHCAPSLSNRGLFPLEPCRLPITGSITTIRSPSSARGAASGERRVTDRREGCIVPIPKGHRALSGRGSGARGNRASGCSAISLAIAHRHGVHGEPLVDAPLPASLFNKNAFGRAGVGAGLARRTEGIHQTALLGRAGVELINASGARQTRNRPTGSNRNSTRAAQANGT